VDIYYVKIVENKRIRKHMKSNFIKLSDKVKIRKEYFGGVLFNMDTGDVIDVDREAFTVILIIKHV
jgi:hypothetical protein